MKKILQQQTSTIGYVAGAAATPYKIGSQSWFITAMLMGMELAKTGANTTATQDYMWRPVTNMQVAGGGTPYWQNGGPDMRVAYWDARLRTQGRVSRYPDMPTGTQTIYHLLPWLPGVNPIHVPTGMLDLFDLSAPVRTDPDLTVNVTWGANSVIASGTNTIATTTALRLTLAGVVLEAGDSQPSYKPMWATTNFAPPAISTGLGTVFNIPTGFWYESLTAMPLLGAATADVRSNGLASAAISEIGLKTKDGRFPITMKTWDLVHLSQEGAFSVSEDNTDVPGATAAYGVAVTSAGGLSPGAFYFDFTRILKTVDPVNPGNPGLAHPDYGANLVSKNDGTLALVMTADVITNVTVPILMRRYGRYAHKEAPEADLGDRAMRQHRHHRPRAGFGRSDSGI
jgi:hypothetical protein